jgi:hypothetical protein
MSNRLMNQSNPASDTENMPKRLIPSLFIAAVLALSACGGDDGSSTAEEPQLEGPSEDVEVIRSWAEALTESDTEAAAEFFAIPSVAENGISYEIETKKDALSFNESLPCGATLEETSVEGEFITATFELTDRPGLGPCPGSGNSAQTSFVIEDGAIVEWHRVALPELPGDGSSGQTT